VFAMLRNEKVRGILYQVLVIAGFILVALFIAKNTAHNIEIRGIKSGFGFLHSTAGFDISTEFSSTQI